MNVKHIPKAAQGVYNMPQAKWHKNLKTLSDDELAGVIRGVLAKAKRRDTQAWEFACLALSELHIRPFAKEHTKELLSFRVDLLAQSKLCLVDHGYSVEVSGIKESILKPDGRETKLIHPYPYMHGVRKTVGQWNKSNSNKTLAEYIELNVPAEKRSAMLQKAIKYLKPEEREAYVTTFEHHKLKIGGKAPKNGQYMFVLSADSKTLLLGEKKKGRFQHTSFFAGAPVACAGNLIIKNRKIVKVTLESGHYKPKKANGELLRAFLSDKKRLGKSSAHHIEIKEWNK